MFPKALAFLLSFSSLSLYGAPSLYKVVELSGKKPPISFELPYTLGTHRGESRAVEGKVEIDTDRMTVKSAKFGVPISSLKTGKSEMECHLREAMGLDYSKSDFPGKHVCDKSHRLPESGPNAIAFPNIQFELEQATASSDGIYEVEGTWTLHGVSQRIRFPLYAQKNPGDGTLLIQGKIPFSLAAFGIKVKRFLFIQVQDGVTVELNLALKHDPA